MTLLLVSLVIALGIFVVMIAVILSAGYIEGLRNPEHQDRPYPATAPKDVETPQH
ncbi:hypothetical protein [Pelagibacterium sp. H642]|uniref:hypothetical protein n=1 Tax=Pelagibacterium sp. H642 TaxID=1881069 RepID=UPI002815EC47|nr:hypothetical protein [Pelagibacterium sp. H642]WMT91046.1 hypothetical protein NO934_01980 [Pelagibacterium sp. H642]